MTYKFVKKCHLWLSVPFGLIISVISLSGLILLFEPAHAHGDARSDFFLNVMRLHRWLLDAPAAKGEMSAGKMVVGISVVAMILILISGILLWWIRARHNIKRNLSISISNGSHKFLSDLHTSGGIYAVLFLLIMAFTGLTWSFGWYREWFYSLFAIEKGSHIMYAIHTGMFGGIATKVLWGIAAFTGFTLPLTGYYLWLRRSQRK